MGPLEGDQETGVGIMAMEEGLDTGPVLLEQRTPIQLLEPSIALAKRLSALTAELMVQAMPLIEAAGPGPDCLLYTSPSPRDLSTSRMPSSA